jgi:hypothetical protein
MSQAKEYIQDGCKTWLSLYYIYRWMSSSSSLEEVLEKYKNKPSLHPNVWSTEHYVTHFINFVCNNTNTAKSSMIQSKSGESIALSVLTDTMSFRFILLTDEEKQKAILDIFDPIEQIDTVISSISKYVLYTTFTALCDHLICTTFSPDYDINKEEFLPVITPATVQQLIAPISDKLIDIIFKIIPIPVDIIVVPPTEFGLKSKSMIKAPIKPIPPKMHQCKAIMTAIRCWVCISSARSIFPNITQENAIAIISENYSSVYTNTSIPPIGDIIEPIQEPINIILTRYANEIIDDTVRTKFSDLKIPLALIISISSTARHHDRISKMAHHLIKSNAIKQKLTTTKFKQCFAYLLSKHWNDITDHSISTEKQNLLSENNTAAINKCSASLLQLFEKYILPFGTII